MRTPALIVTLALAICSLANVTMGETAPASASRLATDDERALLVEAVTDASADFPRWAYTETTVKTTLSGKPRGETIVRYDPSKPYAEQWTPLKVDGHAPTARDLEKYRRRGEEARRRDEQPDAPSRHKSFGELILPAEARVAEESAGSIVFELPLRKDGNNRFPAEKFIAFARIDRASRALTSVSVRLRESFHLKVVAKVKSGEVNVEFATIDPKYGPALTALRGDATGSVLFVNVGGWVDTKRTDIQHVTPYAERFGVQIGELKALDF
jgi:hypothetical protein